MCPAQRKWAPMRNGADMRPSPWQRFIVDVLIAVSAVGVMFAASGVTANARDLLILGASVLIAIGLTFEAKPRARVEHEGPRPVSGRRGDGDDDFEVTAPGTIGP